MHCPVCHSAHTREESFGGFSYLHHAMPLLQCLNCGMRFINHGMHTTEIAMMYQNPKYFDADYAGGASRDYDANRVANERRAHTVLKIIHAHTPGGRLLEIGAAGGHFLRIARDAYGCSVVGLEISTFMSGRARAAGFNVYTGSIYNLNKDAGLFDVIYLGDVLEHVADPVSWLGSAITFLAPRGVMVMELPLSFNPTLAVFFPGIIRAIRYHRFSSADFLPSYHRRKFILAPPYHLLQFNRSSILKLLSIVGLSPVVLKIYDGAPKERFGLSFTTVFKKLTHTLTWYIPMNRFGDRAIVIAKRHQV